MRSVTVTSTFRERDLVPMIRLRGKWLANAGFQEGQRVRVEVASGRIVLAARGDEIDTHVKSA
jgi:hypothetical protein